MDPVPAIALSLTLVSSAVTDLGRRRIPNVLTGSAAAVAVGLAALDLSVGLAEALSVALMLGLPLAGLAALRPEGFGMGDAKLIGVMALFMGWGVWVPLVAGLGLATLSGIAIGLGRNLRSLPVNLPLAPFLAVAALPFLVAAGPWLH